MEKIAHSLEETREIAQDIANKLEPGYLITLRGNLGTGKTTFTRLLVGALGIDARVQSPSFVIARKYTSNKKTATKQNIQVVNHLDLYRLQNVQEAEELDLGQYFNQPNEITIIEWPEIAQELIPARKRIDILFEDLGENTRRIKIEEY